MATAKLEKGHAASLIPSEVINEILLRLPPKSLLRFKSLSKHFLSVISNPDFIAQHIGFSISRSNSTNKPPLLLYRLHHGVPISLLNHDLTITEIFSPFNGQYIESSLNFMGSCNGLLLARGTTISYVKHILLWNPATRHVRHLPLPTPDDDYGYCYGLGFNSHIDDYYVVQIRGKRVFRDDTVVQAKLFSCRKNIWTTLCSNLSRAYSYECPVALKLGGRDHLFWLGTSDDNNRTRFVLAFDLIKLDFRKVEYPLVVHKNEDLGGGLTNFKGYLAVIHRSSEYYSESNNWSIWVMNNENSSDGSGDSWTLIYNIRPLSTRIWPIIIRGDGELIFYNKDSKLCACHIGHLDMDNTSFRQISNTYYFRRGCTYVESLAAPVYGDNAVVDDAIFE